MSILTNILSENFKKNADSILLEQGNFTYTWADIEHLSNICIERINRKINVENVKVFFIAVPFGNQFLAFALSSIKLSIPFVPVEKKNFLENTLNQLVLTDKEYFLLETSLLANSTNSSPIDFHFSESLDSSPLYGIMTSGTTGTPKIPLIPHNAYIYLSNTVKSRVQNVDTWSCIHSVTFGFSTFEYFMPLIIGGKIISYEESISSESNGPIELAKLLINQAQIDVACLTPSGLNLFLQSINSIDKIKFPTTIILSGEPLSQSLFDKWDKVLGDKGITLVNTFASAETGGQIFWNDYINSQQTNQLGDIMPYVKVYLVDSHNNIITGAGTGRLATLSPTNMIGYLNDDKQTNYVYVENENSKALILDDILSRSESGAYFYRGRHGSSIKYKGKLVDLSAISKVCEQSLELKVLTTKYIDQGLVAQIVSFIDLKENDKIEIWPALGEFNEYDSFTYQIMTQPGAISPVFKKAVTDISYDQNVLDLGCGGNLLISELALIGGANKVFAYEIDHKAYEEAKGLVISKNFDRKKIHVSNIDISTMSDIPLASVAVTRIFGNIASADGVIPLVKGVNARTSQPIKWLPEIVRTKIACIDLPLMTQSDFVITPESESFFRKLERRKNKHYRGRICLRNFDLSRIISDTRDFEVLDFNNNKFTLTPSINLKIQSNGLFSGFILWVASTSSSHVAYDNYLKDQKGWLPVYIPVTDEPIKLEVGDTVNIKLNSPNYSGRSPDYELTIQVYRDNTIICKKKVYSLHSKTNSDAHDYLIDNLRTTSDFQSTQHYYNEKLERAKKIIDNKYQQLPDRVMLLNRIPLTKNNKIDNQKLIKYYIESTSLSTPYSKNSSNQASPDSDKFSVSELITYIQGLVFSLNGRMINKSDNFFEAGVASLGVASISASISDYIGKTITLPMIYDHPSCDLLAARIESEYPEVFNQLLSINQINNSLLNKDNDYNLDKLDAIDIKTFARNASLSNLILKNEIIDNSNMVFILSPPRSGSTLLRVLLGSISSVIAPPELELLRFQTLRDWKQKFSGKNKVWREGFTEFLMYIYSLDEDKALILMEQMYSESLPIENLYKKILLEINKSLFVEKSTYYAVFPQVLNRINTLFPNSKILHLIRNPLACIGSYDQLRLDSYSPVDNKEYTSKQTAELIWLNSHLNISKEFRGQSNYKKVFYEDIVHHTKSTLNNIKTFLNIKDDIPDYFDFDSANKKLMISGANDNTKMLGDPNFFKHETISQTEDIKWILSNQYPLSQESINLYVNLSSIRY